MIDAEPSIVAGQPAMAWRRLVEADLAAALVVVACVGFGTNLAMQLVNLGMHARGTGAALIGFSTMMQAVGIVLAAPLAPGLMRRIGVKYTVIAGAIVAAAMMWMFAQVTDFFLLTLLRVLYAAGLALVFTCAEFLMLASVPRRTRGLSAGVYSTVLGLGMAAGPNEPRHAWARQCGGLLCRGCRVPRVRPRERRDPRSGVLVGSSELGQFARCGRRFGAGLAARRPRQVRPGDLGCAA